MSTPRMTALAAAGALTILAGCSQGSSSDAPTSSSSSTAAGPSDASMSDSPSQAASPTWDAKGRKDAASSAKGVLSAFVRTDLPQAAWWRDLAPMLTPAARKVYNTVDVATVPAKEVRGAAKVVDDTSPYLASVEMKTDAGTYTVLLTRRSQDAPWLAERIEPERDR